MKTDLTQTTFIIPIRLDSRDREFNVKFVLNYLMSNFRTNIIIMESDDEPRLRPLMNKWFGISNAFRSDHFNVIINDCNVHYIFEETNSDMFHRTRLLNEMLSKVVTPVVVNYDCDVFMLPQAYKEAQDAILSGKDLIYPYFKGESQVKVEPVDKQTLTGTEENLKELIHNVTVKKNGNIWTSAYGHCCFFNTNSYREGGMEHEGFSSWAPEDTERAYRFQKLGYKVEWLNNYIFHIEHSRGANSSASNPNYKANDDLYRDLMYMDAEQLREYYNNQEYLKKYTAKL